jgi:hypothetical protein
VVSDNPYGYAFINQTLNILSTELVFVVFVSKLFVGLGMKMKISTYCMATMIKQDFRPIYRSVRNQLPVTIDLSTFPRMYTSQK